MTARRALAAAAIFLLGLLAHPAAASAGDQDARCPARVHAWVSDAARAAGVLTFAAHCTSDRVVLRMEPPGALPLDVEINRSPERAFRRAGPLGISPLLQVADFRQVPAARREPFERLAGWIDAHASEVTFGGGALPPPLTAPVEHLGVPPGGPWILVAALLLALAAWAGPRWAPRALPPTRLDPASRRAALALFALALPLRLLLGAWGPLRINGLAPLWILAAAVDPAEAGAYGPGYAEVFSPLVRALPSAPDHIIFAANAVISALLPVLLFALARLSGVDLRRALVAALALALDPVSIRIAATESYVPSIAALTALASLASLAAAGEARHAPRRAVCLALSAGLFCAQAARIHPVAWLPVALAPLAAAAAPRRSPVARVALGLGALAIAGATVAITSAPAILHAYESMLSGETMKGSWIWPDVSLPLILAGLGALLVARPRAPVVLGAFSAIAVISTRHNYGQSALWQASFDRLYLVPLLAGAAAVLPASLGRSRRLVPAAALALVAMFAWRGPGVLRGRTTDHEEYRWVRGWLEDLPPSCRVAWVGFAGRRNLFLPTYVGAARDRSVIARLSDRAPIDAELALTPLGCTYYMRTSLCSSAEGRPVCEGVERQLVLEPVARRSFAAAPSNDHLGYDREVVEAVIARVVGVGR